MNRRTSSSVKVLRKLTCCPGSKSSIRAAMGSLFKGSSRDQRVSVLDGAMRPMGFRFGSSYCPPPLSLASSAPPNPSVALSPGPHHKAREQSGGRSQGTSRSLLRTVQEEVYRHAS